MVSWNPIEVLNGWGDRLSSPLGIIFLIIVCIYIYLRISGRFTLDGLFNRGNKGNGGGNMGGFKNKPDYIMKR